MLRRVRVISVPFFVGAPIPDLEVPEPGVVLWPELPDGTPQQRMAVLFRHLADRVAAEPDPVIFAGDCLSAIGVLAGLQQAGVDPTLIWFDAHGDFNTWETTPSGFLGGMPLAMIVGRGEQSILEGAGLTPLAERRVVLVGARDLDPGEDEALAASELTIVSVAQMLDRDPPLGRLYVHVDVDVVDPLEMPAQNYPAPGGPSLRDVSAALASLAATGRVAAVSFSTWNPTLPGAEQAAAATRELAAPFLSDLAPE